MPPAKVGVAKANVVKATLANRLLRRMELRMNSSLGFYFCRPFNFDVALDNCGG